MPFSVHNTVGICPLCQEENVFFVSHLPQCYRRFCEYLNMKPLCTCDNCDGQHCHIDDIRKRKRSSDYSFDTSDQTHYHQKDENCSKEEVSAEQRMAKHCLVCRKTNPPQGKNKPLPLIRIGKKFAYNIHKIEHIKNEASVINNILKSESELADKEDKEEEQNPLLVQKAQYPSFVNSCCLYCKSVDVFQEPYMWIWKSSTDNAFIFCNIECLIRSLFEGYCTGRSKKNFEENFGKIHQQQGDHDPSSQHSNLSFDQTQVTFVNESRETMETSSNISIGENDYYSCK